MDPISQGSLGAVVPQLVMTREYLGRLLLCGALAGMAPDLDVFISSDVDPLLFLEYHRQFTHALVFIPIGALIVAIGMYFVLLRKVPFRMVYVACLLGYATHGILDACTSYGTQLLWPFTNHRVSWNFVSVFDPAFTLPLLAMVICGVIWRRRVFPVLGLLWAIGYISLGALQGERAYGAIDKLIEQAGHEGADRITIKPSIANLLVWKVIYRHEKSYVVHAVRVGIDGSMATCGEPIHVEQLDVLKHFPSLQDGQQKTDIERFAWFSQDYVAIDPDLPQRITDVRYSMQPNSVKPLWAIDINLDAKPHEHVSWVVNRSLDQEGWTTFWSFLNGSGCRTLH